MSVSRRQMVDLFLTKLRFNMKSEASQTYLGYIWWVLEPALYLGVLFLVFGKFRGRGDEGFVIFLITGILPFLWFSKSVNNANMSIKGGRGLINQVAIPKAFFPLLTVADGLVKQCFIFVLMFAFLLLLGLAPTAYWLFVPVIALVQLLLIIACALAVAAITPFLPDFRFIVGTAMTLLFFMSGVFFDYRQTILEKHQTLFLLNPMARMLKNYRQVLIEGAQPDWLALGLIAFLCALAILLLLWIYRLADTAFARAVT